MISATRSHVLSTVLIGWLGAVQTASAVFPPPIKDDAKFFSPMALEKANQKIRDVYREYHLDVVIQTIAEIPTDQQAKYKEEGKQKFFTGWVRKQIDDLGVHGVYILISKDPKHFQVDWDRGTRNKEFPTAARKKVVEGLLDALKENKFDDGLAGVLTLIQSTLQKNATK